MGWDRFEQIPLYGNHIETLLLT